MANIVPLYFNVDASGFAYPYPATTTDNLQIGKVSATGIAGVAFDANSQRIAAVADPTGPTDAANSQWTTAQIQLYITGLSWKNAVLAATIAVLPDAYTYANGTLGVGATLTKTTFGAFPLIDGVTIPQFARVLIKNEAGANKPYNGIYTLTTVGDGVSVPWVLTRATDNDVITEMVQATVAVDQGSLEGTTWIQNATIVTMGTTDVNWVAGPSLTAYTASTGLVLVGSDFRVKPGDGIEVVSNTASTNVRLDGTAAGLEFTGAAGSGALRVKREGSTLNLTSTGLSVAYAPDYQTTRTTDGTGVTKGAGVYYSGNGVVGDGDNSNIAKCGIIGVALTTVGASSPVQLGQNGSIITALLPSDGHIAGTPYYLGTAGTPVLAGALGGGARVIRLGYAVASGAASALEVSMQDMGKKP